MRKPASDEAPPLPAIVELDAPACRDLLGRQRQCVLAVVDGDAPYAVPVYYGFDGHTVYLGVSEGRKTRALDTNPHVCIVVAESGPGDAWRSVALAGRAVTLTGEGRARGIEALLEHNRKFADAGGAPTHKPRRPAGGRVIRIDEVVITGRMRPVAE